MTMSVYLYYLQGMQHGKISCTRESAFESTCDMECHKGYHIIEGESKSTCQNDHLWTPVLGKCESKSLCSCQIIF